MTTIVVYRADRDVVVRFGPPANRPRQMAYRHRDARRCMDEVEVATLMTHPPMGLVEPDHANALADRNE